MTDTIYRESQKMDDMLLYVLLALLAIFNLIFYRIYQVTDEVYIQMSLVTLIIFVFIFKILRLDTRFTNQGVYYRFFPFHNKEKQITWAEIESVECIKIRPLRDYGGYGIRYNFTSKAYIMKGNHALQFIWKDGRKPLVIGIQNVSEIKSLLSKWLPPSRFVDKT